jgi:type IV pilus assembly protein PilO
LADFSLTKLPWHIQLAIFIGLSVAGAGAFWWFYESPEREAIAIQERELAGIRAKINTGLATARRLPEFRKEVDALQAQLNSLKPILPDERDAGELLRRVHGLALESNLQLRNFKPLAINTRELHAEWPMTLSLEGTYHNLGVFLDKVSKFPRIINIGNIVIAGKTQPDPTASIDVNCTATTFVMVEAAPAPPPGKRPPPVKAAPKKTE